MRATTLEPAASRDFDFALIESSGAIPRVNERRRAKVGTD